MENEFIKNPILIDILGLRDGELVSKSKYLFVGSVPGNVLNSVKKAISGKNPGELNYYGKNWGEKLGLAEPVHGGTDDPFLDIDELLPEKPAKPTKPEKKSQEKKSLEKEEPQVEMQQVAKINIIDDIFIYPEDNIADLKEKIFAATNIEPFKQHIFIKAQGDVKIPLNYQIVMDGIVNIDISKIIGKDMVSGIPVDMELYENNETIAVRAKDESLTMRQLYQKFGTTRIYLVNIEEFIQVPLSLEESNKEIIYYGFCIKYWPMLSKEAFKMFISGEKISTTFPLLSPTIEGVKKKLIAESKLLEFKYELLTDAKNQYNKFPEFAQFNPMNDADEKKLVHSYVKSSIIETAPTVQKKALDLFQLFNNFKTTEKIPIIKAQLQINGKTMVLVKIMRGFEEIYEKSQLKSHFLFDSIVFYIMKKEYSIILTINSNGVYTLKSTWDNIKVTLEDIFKIIPPNINPIVEEINSMGREIFISHVRLTKVKKFYSVFSGLEITIEFGKVISQETFNEYKKTFNSDVMAGILLLDSMDDTSITFYLMKGIMINSLDSHDYSYLTNQTANERWLLERKIKKIIISLQATFVRCDILNINEEEFTNFYQYFISRLFILNSMKVKKTDVIHTKKLKSLKARDPKLFDFKSQNVNIVYSRICQKKRQPVMYSKQEYDSLPDSIRKELVKYWNFTTSSPVWYHCPNKKYPYLNFLLKYHPDKFCIPCCNMSDSAKPGEGKRHNVFSKCLEKHIYEGTTTPSRYVMVYGKSPSPGKLGKLPPTLEKFFDVNIVHIETIIEGIIDFGEKQYSIKKIWRNTRNNRIHEKNISSLLDFLYVKSWSYHIIGSKNFSPIDIIKNPKLSPSHYNRILGSDLKFPIIAFYDKNGNMHIIDGIHRLAKAYIEKIRTVHLKFITSNQLKSSMVTEDSKYRDNLHKKTYFAYGVKQDAYISGIGLFYTYAEALKIHPDELIKKMVKLIKNNEEKILGLLGGGVLEYFQNAEDLCNELENILTPRAKNLPIWNELIMDIMRIYFEKNTIIFDDTTPDISGTSTKITQVQHDMNIIIPKFETIREFMTNKNGANEFIVVLRRMQKNKRVFVHNFTYSPIFMIILQDFFKRGMINKRIFDTHDQLIELLSRTLEPKFKSEPPPSSLNYTNLAGFIYYKSVKINDNQIIVPVHYQHSNNLTDNKKQLIKKSNQDPKIVLQYITKNHINPQKILEFNGSAIGVQADGLNYYFKKISLGEAKKLFEIDEIYHVFYDPDIINKEISKYNPAEQKILPGTTALALYNNYVYQLLVLEFMNYFDQEINSEFRSKVYKKISGVNIYDMVAISDLKQWINEQIKNAGDIDALTNLINIVQKHFDKKLLLDQIKEAKFTFDQITLSKITEILESENPKKSIIKLLTPIAQKITTSKKGNIGFSGVPEICQNNEKDDISPCIGGKLYVSRELLQKLLELFADDFINPFKRKFLLSTTFRFKTLNKFSLKRFAHEKIYVNL